MNVKASDLVRRALSLADLNNTSFTTSEENRCYINLAFVDVYQTAINEGEKYYWKTVEVNGSGELPEDFYQLYDIKTLTGDRVRKRSRDSYAGERWYDIVGNRLLLNEVPAAVVEYYPLPFTLDPSETGDVDLDFPNHIFYQILALRLAEYYKIKQGGDVSGIELLLDEAWTAYYNILHRDLDQPVKITDTKTVRRRY